MPSRYDDDPTQSRHPWSAEERLDKIERALFNEEGDNRIGLIERRLDDIFDYIKGARLINGIIKWALSLAVPVIAVIAYIKGGGK